MSDKPTISKEQIDTLPMNEAVVLFNQVYGDSGLRSALKRHLSAEIYLKKRGAGSKATSGIATMARYAFNFLKRPVTPEEIALLLQHSNEQGHVLSESEVQDMLKPAPTSAPAH